jgi:hypothetical protein
MSTAQEIIDQGFSHSSKMIEDEIIEVTGGDEALLIVQTALKGVFTYAARVNPFFWGARSVIPASSGAWPRPTDAELVFRLEMEDGTEVIAVDLDDQEAADGEPGVFRLGQAWYSVDEALLDSTADPLVVFYAQRLALPGSLGAVIDTRWPTWFDNLLSAEFAAWALLKDGRTEEAQAIISVYRDPWLARLEAFLQHEQIGMRRRFARELGQLTLPTHLLAAVAR